MCDKLSCGLLKNNSLYVLNYKRRKRQKMREGDKVAVIFVKWLCFCQNISSFNIFKMVNSTPIKPKSSSKRCLIEV